MSAKKEKLIIYQLFPRLFGNDNVACVPHGTYEQNGCGKMSQINEKALGAIKDLGVNCIWYTGIIEHATKTEFESAGIPADNPYVVKGEAGSPYAIKDYYDVAPSIADDPTRRMTEFEDLVKRTHRAGLKVLIDFVPNHTARHYHSDVCPPGIRDFGTDDNINMFFSPSNNYYYITCQQFSPSFPIGHGTNNEYVEFPAKATGNDCFNAFCTEYDWYETVKLNYGKDYGNGSEHFDPIPDTWLKMLNILRFWASKGIDGFRCDMVFMVPLAFWHWAIPNVKKDFPNIIFIGEIYDIGLYRPFLDYGCFDYLYDKVNLYDTLVGIQTSNISAARLTGCWQSVDGLGDRMLNFLENHDEVRFGSQAYAGNPALVIPSLVVSAMISTGPMMVYYGQELGESAAENEGFAGDNNRTTIFDYWSLDTLRRWRNDGKYDGGELTENEKWLRAKYSRILHLCNSEKAISEGSFFDLMYVNLQNRNFNPHRQFAFMRHYGEETLIIVANFSDSKENIEINIPEAAFEMMHLPDGEGVCMELLSGERMKKTLSRGKPFCVAVGAYDAVVWRIRHKNFRHVDKVSASK